jgi:hypothetical protein
MPTVAGIPIGQTARPVGPLGNPLNPVDWLDAGSPNTIDGAQQTPLMRGTGGALAWWQRRQMRGPATIPQGAPFYIQSRPYSRGAGAYSPKFGVIPTNPIGAGVYAQHKLPVIAGPGARYQFGAIFFNVQAVPTTIRMSPTMPAQSIAALLATSTVAGMYATTG